VLYTIIVIIWKISVINKLSEDLKSRKYLIKIKRIFDVWPKDLFKTYSFNTLLLSPTLKALIYNNLCVL